jgi:spore coat protein U domain-containing protein, fimbrial subunit CupE1/2/3/6
MNRRLVFAVLFLLACSVRPASAATCALSSTNIQFGTFSGTTINISGTITVNCPSGTAYQVGINAGTGAGATVTNRLMSGPASALLGYGLFSNAAHTSNWGNTSGTGWVAGTGIGSNQTLTVYAQLPSNEYAPAGNYNDATITVSVSGTGLTTSTSNFNVKTTVAKACNIAANSLNFGTYSGTLINSTSTISVRCTGTTTYNVGLNAGTASGATVTNRSMTGSGGALLGYKLFRDSAHTLNWGNTVGTDTVAGTGNGAVQSLTVYGQMPAGEVANPGSYADTITATITY